MQESNAHETKVTRSKRKKLGGLILCILIGCVVMALGFLVGTAVVLLCLDKYDPSIDAREIVANGLISFVANLPWIGDTAVYGLEAAGFVDTASRFIYLSALLVGTGIGLLSSHWWAKPVYFRLFAAMDFSVLEPIRSPKAIDPLRGTIEAEFEDSALAWIEPTAQERQAAWAALKDFCLGQGPAFRYQFLVGGSGAGKSRFAVEFSRRELGKLGASDDGKHIFHGPDNFDQPLTRFDVLKSWWRVQVLQRPPMAKDIWDLGWLTPDIFGIEHEIKKDIVLVLDQLEGWRPRKPTFLLLDDPLPGNALQVVASLNKQSTNFSHPVRLLVVNQSVPSEFGMNFDRRSARWNTSSFSSYSDPIILNSRDQFDDADVRRLANASLPPMVAKQIITDSGVDSFRTVTDGNPLLTELGISWLKRGMKLQDMSKDALLMERTHRILDAFRSAGFGSGAEEVFSAATIASGLPVWQNESKSILNPISIWQKFGMNRVDLQVLRRFFEVVLLFRTGLRLG